MTDDEIDAFKAGYLAGFMASGEVWNGEYPFEGRHPLEDAYWVLRREEAVRRALASHGGQHE